MLFFFKYNVRTQKEQSVNFKVGLEKSRFLPWVSSPNFMKKKLTWRRKQPPLKLRRFLCIKVKWKQEGPTTNWSGPNKYVLRMRWRFSPKKKKKRMRLRWRWRWRWTSYLNYSILVPIPPPYKTVTFSGYSCSMLDMDITIHQP